MTLREYRKRAGMKLEDVGNAVDVTPAAVSNWETGRNRVLRKYKERLAALYEVDVKDIEEATKSDIGRH